MSRMYCLMKKGVVCGILFFVATTSSLFAQQRWSAGPRAGLNLSTQIGEGNSKLLPGFAAGAFVMYSDINHFGISADVLYSQRGFTYKITDTQGVLKWNQRVNYLEIPILFRYFLNLSGNFRPNLFVGPNLGLKLNANRIDFDPKRKTDNGPLYRPADLGATFGFSLNFRVKEAQRLHFDARYNLGLTDITDPTKRNPDGVVRNSTISFLVGYGFGVGRKYPSRRR